jgi:predicted YcjX-like family ATPase
LDLDIKQGTSDLRSLLKSDFPPLYDLYLSLKGRREEPTQEERRLANGTVEMTKEKRREYQSAVVDGNMREHMKRLQDAEVCDLLLMLYGHLICRDRNRGIRSILNVFSGGSSWLRINRLH